MSSWMSVNLSTILISAVLLVVAAVIILRLVGNRRKGKSSCGCGCANCAMHDACHAQKRK